MLEYIFAKIIDMSFTASIIIVIVMIARILLKRYPKYISYALWSVVLFRLICPFSIETSISVVPNSNTILSDNILASNTLDNEIIEDNVNTASNMNPTDLAVIDGETELGYATIVKPDITKTFNFSKLTLQEKIILLGKYIWLFGIGIMLLYSIISAIKIHRKVMVSVKLRDNIYITDEKISPFVMGLVHPKIYLPYCLNEKEQKYIILHEQYHIKRFDNIIKMMSFIALSIHWFNPLVWIAFILSGKDMEMSCDEAVINALGEGIKADYSASLLAIARGYKGRKGLPVAFGESDTKTRIKNLAHMKNVKKGVLAVVIVSVIVLIICLATNRSSSSENVDINAENEAFENGALDNILSQKEYAADMENIFFTRDYDNDGNIESFVIVGNKDDFYGDEMLYGDLWFVSSEFEANALLNDAYMYIEQQYFEADDSKSYLVFSYIEGNPVLSDVYGVVDGMAVGMVPYGESVRIEGDEIIVTCSDYDFNCDKDDFIFTGHTWKDYAFYYENGQFLPYKGETVTSDYMGTYENGLEINDELLSDDRIVYLQYIKRENGYLQINIARDDGDSLTFSHRTYRADDKNKLELIEEDEGCYKVNIDDDSETSFPSIVVENYYEAENSWDIYWGTASQMTEFVDKLKQYLTDGDIDAIYNNMASQIDVRTEQINGTVSLTSLEQFSEYYSDIFNDEVYNEILEVESTDVWASWRGVCVGNGCLWLQPLTENGNCIGYEISAVNQLDLDNEIYETISLADQWINECEAVGYSEDDAKKLYAKMEQDGVNLDENYEITDIRFADFDSNSEEDWIYILRVRNGVITNETFESGWLIIYLNGSLAYKMMPPSYTFEKLSQFNYGDLDNDGIIEIEYAVSLGGAVETDLLYKEKLKYIKGKLEVQ